MIQHPELDGPFSVPTGYSMQTIAGATYLAPTGMSDSRWNTTQALFVANAPALARYRVSPVPMLRVWAGDDPATPAHTVALAFPDGATATTVLTACGAITQAIP